MDWPLASICIAAIVCVALILIAGMFAPKR
jgi:hypothetical protein